MTVLLAYRISHPAALAIRGTTQCRKLRGWGRVINISSAASLHPPARAFSSYLSSKIALNLFTRCLAAEIAGTGVTANAVHPGEVKTAMWQDIAEQTARDDQRSGGMRRWLECIAETGGDPPAKAAGVVRWPCSDEATAINVRFVWIPGGLQTPLPVDWGMVAPDASIVDFRDPDGISPNSSSRR